MPEVKKPNTLVYALEDKPPPLITLFNGIQHVGLIAINLVYPLLIFRVVEAPVDTVSGLLSVGMLVLGVATFLQAMRLGPVGSGYMCPATFTATYFAPSLLAARLGGLPLVFGMTIFAGALESALAPLLHRLRAIFPPEISGVIILMIGVSAGMGGLRSLVGPTAAPVMPAEWWVAGITLATMVALNVWGTGVARMLCALIGLAVGYAAAGIMGLVGANLTAVNQAAWIGLPSWNGITWSFDLSLAVPFAIASIAAAMKAAGTITICQRINDANWVRPDMQTITKGVLADGLSTALAGIAGAVGINTSTPAVGLSSATGVASRQVAFAVGAIFLLLGFLPKLTALFAVMPRAVILSALLFTVTFIIVNGLQILTSRLLDTRRTLVIGLSLIAGVAIEAFPGIAAGLPASLVPDRRFLAGVLDHRCACPQSAVSDRGAPDGRAGAAQRRDRSPEGPGFLCRADRAMGRPPGRGEPGDLRGDPAHRQRGGGFLDRRRLGDHRDLRRVQSRRPPHLSGRDAGISGATADARADQRKRERRQAAGRLHAAAQCRPRARRLARRGPPTCTSISIID